MGHPGSSISGYIKKRSSNNCFEFDSKGVHDFMYSRFLFQLSFFFKRTLKDRLWDLLLPKLETLISNRINEIIYARGYNK